MGTNGHDQSGDGDGVKLLIRVHSCPFVDNSVPSSRPSWLRGSLGPRGGTMKPWYRDDLFWLALALSVGVFFVPACILLARDILRNYWHDRRAARREAQGFEVGPAKDETSGSS